MQHVLNAKNNLQVHVCTVRSTCSYVQGRAPTVLFQRLVPSQVSRHGRLIWMSETLLVEQPVIAEDRN